jgi:hypothetical protein
MREIQSVHSNTWRALPHLRKLERLIIRVEMSKVNDDAPANDLQAVLPALFYVDKREHRVG